MSLCLIFIVFLICHCLCLEFTGRVEVFAADTIEHGHQGFYSYLIDENDALLGELLLAPNAQQIDIVQFGGKEVIIEGYQVNRSIFAETIAEIDESISTQGIFDVKRFYFKGVDGGFFTGSTHYIRYIILGNSDNGSSCPGTQTNALKALVNMRTAYERLTNDRIDRMSFIYSGCVFLSYSKYDYSDSTVYRDIFTDAVGLANSWVYSSKPFTTIVFMEKNAEFSWAGMGSVGSNSQYTNLSMWVNGYFLPSDEEDTSTSKGSEWVLNHELGHHFGLHHSNLMSREDDLFYADFSTTDYGDGEYRDIGDIMGAYSYLKTGNRPWFSANQQTTLGFASEDWICRVDSLSSGNSQEFRARIWANDDLRTKNYLEQHVSTNYSADVSVTSFSSLRYGQLPNCLAVVIPLEPTKTSILYNYPTPEIWLEYRAEFDLSLGTTSNNIWTSGFGVKAVFVTDHSIQRSMAAANNIDLTSAKTATESTWEDGGRLMPGQRWVCPPNICKYGDQVAITLGTAMRRSDNYEVVSDISSMDGIDAVPSFLTVKVERNLNTSVLTDVSYSARMFLSSSWNSSVLTPAGFLSENGSAYFSYTSSNLLAFHKYVSTGVLDGKFTVKNQNSDDWIHYLSRGQIAVSRKISYQGDNGLILSKSVVPFNKDSIHGIYTQNSSQLLYKFSASSYIKDSVSDVLSGHSIRDYCRSSIVGYTVLTSQIRYSSEITAYPGDLLVWIKVYYVFNALPADVEHEFWTSYGERLIPLESISVVDDGSTPSSLLAINLVPYLLRNHPKKPLPNLISLEESVVKRSTPGDYDSEIDAYVSLYRGLSFMYPATSPRVVVTTETPSIAHLTDIPADYMMFRPRYTKRVSGNTSHEILMKTTGQRVSDTNYNVSCTDVVYSPTVDTLIDFDFSVKYPTGSKPGNSDYIIVWGADFMTNSLASGLSSLSNEEISHKFGIPISLQSSKLDGTSGVFWAQSEVITSIYDLDGTVTFSTRVPAEAMMADAVSPGLSKICMALSAPSGVEATLNDVRFLERTDRFMDTNGPTGHTLALSISSSPSITSIKLKTPYIPTDGSYTEEDSPYAILDQPFLDSSVLPTTALYLDAYQASLGISKTTNIPLKRYLLRKSGSFHNESSIVYPATYGNISFSTNTGLPSQTSIAFTLPNSSKVSDLALRSRMGNNTSHNFLIANFDALTLEPVLADEPEVFGNDPEEEEEEEEDPHEEEEEDQHEEEEQHDNNDDDQNHDEPTDQGSEEEEEEEDATGDVVDDNGSTVGKKNSTVTGNGSSKGVVVAVIVVIVLLLGGGLFYVYRSYEDPTKKPKKSLDLLSDHDFTFNPIVPSYSMLPSSSNDRPETFFTRMKKSILDLPQRFPRRNRRDSISSEESQLLAL